MSIIYNEDTYGIISAQISLNPTTNNYDPFRTLGYRTLLSRTSTSLFLASIKIISTKTQFLSFQTLYNDDLENGSKMLTIPLNLSYTEDKLRHYTCLITDRFKTAIDVDGYYITELQLLMYGAV